MFRERKKESIIHCCRKTKGGAGGVLWNSAGMILHLPLDCDLRDTVGNAVESRRATRRRLVLTFFFFLRGLRSPDWSNARQLRGMRLRPVGVKGGGGRGVKNTPACGSQHACSLRYLFFFLARWCCFITILGEGRAGVEKRRTCGNGLCRHGTLVILTPHPPIHPPTR